MVKWRRANLATPPDVGIEHWVDSELEGTISVFDSAVKVEETHIEMDPYSDWFVSHIDANNKICNSFDMCYVPFYECLFTQLRLRFPFSGLKQKFLNHLDTALYHLHLFSQAFVNVF